MADTARTVRPAQERRTPVWTGLVLLLLMLVAFSITALILAHHHRWTDALAARLPVPGPATSLASDPGLVAQMRMSQSRAWLSALADRSTALVAETVVTNDSLLPVSGLVVEARSMAAGSTVATAFSACGKAVSSKLLSRLPAKDLAALMDLPSLSSQTLDPGASLRCQVAFPKTPPGVDEVRLRVVSAEPHPGHPPARLLYVE